MHVERHHRLVGHNPCRGRVPWNLSMEVGIGITDSKCRIAETKPGAYLVSYFVYFFFAFPSYTHSSRDFSDISMCNVSDSWMGRVEISIQFISQSVHQSQYVTPSHHNQKSPLSWWNRLLGPPKELESTTFFCATFIQMSYVPRISSCGS